MNKLPVRRDGPPKGVRQFQPPQKTEEYRERQRFYGRAAWKKCRLVKLRQNPLCEMCEAAGRIEPSTEVHHKIERLERPDLSYTLSNLEALCKVCHSKISRHRINEREHGQARPQA